MEGQHALASHGGLALGHGSRVSGLGAKVVARGEQVAGVDQMPIRSGRAAAVDHGRQFAERASDRVAAPAVFSRATLMR